MKLSNIVLGVTSAIAGLTLYLVVKLREDVDATQKTMEKTLAEVQELRKMLGLEIPVEKLPEITELPEEIKELL